MDLNLLTIDAARSAVQERKTTAVALAEAMYDKIERDDPRVGAFLTLSKERALAKAWEMDALAAKGEQLPPLGGVPVGIKDVLVTKGARSTAGSKILGQLRAALRLHGGGATGSGGRGGAGEDELRRVRHGFIQRELGLEAGAQSARSEPRAGRFFGRVRCGGGRGHGGGDARFGHRRFDSAAGFFLRRGWVEAHVWACVALRI